jgi:hypothetical protein
MDCAPRQSTTRKHPHHAEQAVTPTSTSRRLRAAIAGAAPSRLPRRIGGGVKDRIISLMTAMLRVRSSSDLRFLAPPRPRGGAGEARCYAMASSKHRDAPEGVQEQWHAFLGNPPPGGIRIMRTGSHPHRHGRTPARSHRRRRAVPTPPPNRRGSEVPGSFRSSPRCCA